jgi:hypothetical protein
MIEVNWLAIIVCAVVGMGIGALWHSKMLFGNAFMEASGMDMNMPPEKMKEIQKGMWKYYLTQFILLLIQLYFLSIAILIMSWGGRGGDVQESGVMTGVLTALGVWLGFIIPSIGGQCLWSNRPRKMAWRLFFINAGYMLVSLLIFGAILGAWM